MEPGRDQQSLAADGMRIWKQTDQIELWNLSMTGGVDAGKRLIKTMQLYDLQARRQTIFGQQRRAFGSSSSVSIANTVYKA